MGTISHAFHVGARPIGYHEFADAVRAICLPRFPSTTGNVPRPVALAVSGGVDSMALAFLCSHLRASSIDLSVSDNPIQSFRAFIVDHGLRDGSNREARSVSAALREMGLESKVVRLNWTKALGQDQDPRALPNVESIARKLRYQTLGQLCARDRIASLFLAHHQDDQYETVLMRLLQGHRARGLRGIKPAVNIPECEGIHGVHQSGYIDDQMAKVPYYNNNISRRQKAALLRDLWSGVDNSMHESELENWMLHGSGGHDVEEVCQTRQPTSAEVPTPDVESGGVMVYRPLLEFSKDRLIATCEANGIPWWEDATNGDPTLTMRNAIRHVCRNFTLPIALQKPSILALSRRCEDRTRALEAESNRLLAQTIIYDLELNIGSLCVQFPSAYDLSRFPRDKFSPLRRRARIMRQREVAGLLIRKVTALVSPEHQTRPLVSWQDAISRLFPALSLSTREQSIMPPPKAFVVAGVHFLPLEPSPPSRQKGGILKWYLSRTPYPAHLPIPHYRCPYWALTKTSLTPFEGDYRWCQWTGWVLWDGRFWFRMRHRLPYRVHLRPYLIEHAKAFRELLTRDDRRRLATLLKHYAPGKTRYTLPALYIEEDLDLNNVSPRPYYPVSPSVVHTMSRPDDLLEHEGNMDPTCEHPQAFDVFKTKLVSLPSIGIQAPGLRDWVEYEVRARWVDRDVLRTSGSFRREPFVPPRRTPQLPGRVQLKRRHPIPDP